MGLIISRFRKNKTIKEKLQNISKDIKSIESFRLHTQQKQRTIVGRFVLLSVLFLIVSAATLYFWALPERTVDKILYLVPFIFFPFIIVFLKRIITWYYARQLKNNETKLEQLKEEKKKLLDDVMDKETYKAAKEILEQFAPEQLRKDTNNALAIRPNSSGPVVGRPSLPLQSPQLMNQELRRRTMTPVANQVAFNQPTPLRTMPGQPPYPMQAQRPGGMPGGPPMPRPILPRDRGVMDKLVEFIVGDGPANRFALICRQCGSHNGMALQEEFEYLAFRCCYCFNWNPSRKQRPPAPLLQLPSAPPGEKDESSLSSESEAEEEAKEGNSEEANLSEASGEAAENGNGQIVESEEVGNKIEATEDGAEKQKTEDEDKTAETEAKPESNPQQIMTESDHGN